MRRVSVCVMAYSSSCTVVVHFQDAVVKAFESSAIGTATVPSLVISPCAFAVRGSSAVRRSMSITCTRTAL